MCYAISEDYYVEEENEYDLLGQHENKSLKSHENKTEELKAETTVLPTANVMNTVIISHKKIATLPTPKISKNKKDVTFLNQKVNSALLTRKADLMRLKVKEALEMLNKEETTPQEPSVPVLRRFHNNKNSKYFESKKFDKNKNHKAAYLKLKPAIEYVDEYFDNSTNQYKDKSVWFVPEPLPCWNLPLLFAANYSKRRTRGSFKFYPAFLKNVTILQKSKEANSTVKPILIQVELPEKGTYSYDWCRQKPCYGDNTLCLFPTKKMSKLCSRNYKVVTPSLAQRDIIVNTINAMRNGVASGNEKIYKHLPTASNMRKILYDTDLQEMAQNWLLQCLPGPAPCSSIANQVVNYLECLRLAEDCCSKEVKGIGSNCIPEQTCFVDPFIGSIYTWFASAKDSLQPVDIRCGKTDPETYFTAQMLWAKTEKVGCAYAKKANGDIRVVCNFTPGPPFRIKTKYFCGIQPYEKTRSFDEGDITDLSFLSSLGLNMDPHMCTKYSNISNSELETLTLKGILWDKAKTVHLKWGVDTLSGIYQQGWVRRFIKKSGNSSIVVTASLVTQYLFTEETNAKCDTQTPIYREGPPGSDCLETSSRFRNLCYEYRESASGYRILAIVAPAALFTLILYDLFSSVMRQSNN